MFGLSRGVMRKLFQTLSRITIRFNWSEVLSLLSRDDFEKENVFLKKIKPKKKKYLVFIFANKCDLK